MPWNQTQPNHIYLKYMYKEDFVLNNLQGLIYHKTKLIKHLFYGENSLIPLQGLQSVYSKPYWQGWLMDKIQGEASWENFCKEYNS